MRIGLLTYRGNPFCGGQGVYVSALANELARQGHRVHVISGPPYPPEMRGVELHRVPGLALHLDNGGSGATLGKLTPLRLYEEAALRLGRFPEMTAFSWRAWFAVQRIVRQHGLDVIHDNQTLGWGLLPMRWLGVPVIATVHHPLTIDRARGFEPPTSFRQQLSRMLFYPIGMQMAVARRMARVVTVSQASAAAIAEDFRVPRERIKVVYNGLDTAFFHPPAEPRRVPGRVLYVGNLEDRNKGAVYLLRAVPRLPPGAHLWAVISSRRVPDWALRLVKELGVAERVTFETQLGPEDLRTRYQQAEVAVSPSLFEGFGFPAGEAMASGLPIAAARGGALPEVVGDAGIVVPTRDPEALAEALTRLLKDGQLRERLGRMARERAVELFSWPRAARELVAIYEELREEARHAYR